MSKEITNPQEKMRESQKRFKAKQNKSLKIIKNTKNEINEGRQRNLFRGLKWKIKLKF